MIRRWYSGRQVKVHNSGAFAKDTTIRSTWHMLGFWSCGWESYEETWGRPDSLARNLDV